MEGDVILEAVKNPDQLRRMSTEQLDPLVQAIRNKLINITSITGGHLGASLGTVELTIALHYVFNTPTDKLVWDTSHQTYVHKMLTDRMEKMHSIRQTDGISGFCVREESEYDTFGAGHTSTSLSAAQGMLVDRMTRGKQHEIIAIIGDGAMSAGMAYEALNNLEHFAHQRFILILNDNGMSISPSIGSLHRHLEYLRQKHQLLTAAEVEKHLAADSGNHSFSGNFFETFGLRYLGIIDGHNITELVKILQAVKTSSFSYPLLLHVKTDKGHGYAPAMAASNRLHATPPFDIATGKATDAEVGVTYTNVFVDSLIAAMQKDDSIVAVTAAMMGGSGLDKVKKVFPERVIDVAIAEQHAVTLCSGMASCNMKPVCALYSTFLQRAYDQVIHDVAIQNLPVRFLVDRAGVVGYDGPTHHGVFDLCFLRALPNFIVMAPSASSIELARAVKTALAIDNAPSAVRYPRGKIDITETWDWDSLELLPIGKSHISESGERVAILSCGHVLNSCLAARRKIQEKIRLKPTIVDARFVKPIDTDLLRKLAGSHEVIITIEDGVEGGYGSAVAQYLMSQSYAGKFRSLSHGSSVIPQDSTENLYRLSNMDPDGIARTVYELLKVTQ